MKKLLGIVVLGLLLGGYANASIECTQERKEWIKHIKELLRQDLINVVYSDHKCIAKILTHNGKTIEEHNWIRAQTNRENFRNPNFDNSIYEALYELFKDIEPAPINWVPKDYKAKKIK